MISPELLRRYPFFGFLNDSQLKAVAMLSEEVVMEKGEDLEGLVGSHGDSMYFLAQGSAEIYYVIHMGEQKKDFYITDINPGEIFGFAALFDGTNLVMRVRASSRCRAIKVSASGLQALCQLDDHMGYGLMKAIAQASLGRINDLFVQLAAVREEVQSPIAR